MPSATAGEIEALLSDLNYAVSGPGMTGMALTRMGDGNERRRD
jgi:hypothetical protein